MVESRSPCTRKCARSAVQIGLDAPKTETSPLEDPDDDRGQDDAAIARERMSHRERQPDEDDLMGHMLDR